MATCKDCVCFDMCDALDRMNGLPKPGVTHCGFFKDKALTMDLPCKVGDKVYELGETDENVYYIEELTVTEVATTRLFVSAWVPAKDDIAYEIPYERLGKNVFLTREAAEAELKGKQNA